MVIFVPCWRWRQRRQSRITLRAVLTRLLPLVSLTRLVLPAVLTRLVAPLLMAVAFVPAPSTSATSTTVAPIVSLGELTEAPVKESPKLLAVAGVVDVDVVEGAEWSLALG